MVRPPRAGSPSAAAARRLARATGVPADVAWPLAILDLEASGLDARSFPIEVGFARWRGPRAPIETWSTLVRPDRDWIEDGVWSPEAEALHGIAVGDLAAGAEPRSVCARLDAELAGSVVCCDGIEFDVVWLARLYEAAGGTPAFTIESMRRLVPSGVDFVRWSDDGGPLRHRAAADAFALMRVFASALGQRPKHVALP